MVSVISDDALAVIFSGSQLAANARKTVALATADERLFVRWLPIKKRGSVRVAVSANLFLSKRFEKLAEINDSRKKSSTDLVCKESD